MYEIALFLQVVLCVSVCYYWFVAKRSPFYNLVSFYIFFHIVCFVIRPLLAYWFSFDRRWIYMRIWPTESEKLLALAVSSFGLLMFVLGYNLASRVWSSPIQPKFHVVITRHDRQAFALTVCALAPLILYSMSMRLVGYDFNGTGAGIEVVQHFANGASTLKGSTGYIVNADSFMTAIFLGLVVVSRFRLWSLAFVVSFIGYRAYVGWSRWAAVIIVIAILIAWLNHKKRSWPRIGGVVVALVIFVGFQAVGFNRNLLRDELAGVSRPISVQQEGRSIVEKLDNGDFANFEYLVYVVRAVPDLSKTYTYFTQYLQLFTEPIPRLLWEEKPLGPPLQLVNLMDYGNFWGLTTSLVGDGWLSLGWAGVAITLTLAGAVSAFVQHKLTRAEPGLYRYLVFCLSIAISLQWFRDGGISIFKFVLFSCAPIILWYGIFLMLRSISRAGIRVRGRSSVRYRLLRSRRFQLGNLRQDN